MNNTIRYLLIAGLVGYLAVSNGVVDVPGIARPAVVAPYAGKLDALHQASREMTPEHRAKLAAAFDAGADTYEKDRDTVGTMAQFQAFVSVLVRFGYRGMNSVTESYPEVAKAINAELTRVTGGVDVAIAEQKPALVQALRDIAAAVR